MQTLVGVLGNLHTSSESLPEFWRGLMAGLSEATSAVTHICAHALALNRVKAHPACRGSRAPHSGNHWEIDCLINFCF